MSEAFLLSAARTPLVAGPLESKGQSETPVLPSPPELSRIVLQAALQSLGVPRERVELILWAGTGPETRTQILDPLEIDGRVPWVAVEAGDCSSQQALHLAAQAVLAGDVEIALAGGAYGGASAAPAVEFDQTRLAESWARARGITRADLDRAVREQLAPDAALSDPDPGRLVPLAVDGGDSPLFTDQGLADAGFADRLDGLPTLEPHGQLTIGHFLPVASGAAALALASPRAVGRYNLAPRALIAARSLLQSPPETAWESALPAARQALERAGLQAGSLDLVLLQASFLGLRFDWLREFGMDPARLLSARATAGPASGALGIWLLLEELERRAVKVGLLVTASLDGLAAATVIERV